MAEQGPARTEFASKALEMSTLFAMRFKEAQIGDKAPRRVQVQQMDVETTGGGKQARMAIILAPQKDKGAGGRPLVCGWIDIAKSRVRMRSYATVGALFKQQNKRFFDLTEADYQKFLDEAREFLDENNFHFDVFDEAIASAAPKPEAQEAAAGGRGPILIVSLVILVAAILALVMLFD